MGQKTRTSVIIIIIIIIIHVIIRDLYSAIYIVSGKKYPLLFFVITPANVDQLS